MTSLSAWIGLRYLRAKKRSGFISLISIISVLGIALGVATLIVVLSVMNGFQKDIRGKLLSVAPHAEIGFFENDGSRPWQDLRKLTAGNKAVLSTAPYVADQALLANAGEVRGVQVRGIDPSEEMKVADYGKGMTAGSFNDLKPGAFDIILGADLAAALDVKPGEKVTVITPEGNATPAGMVPRLKQFTVAGLVKTGVYEMDNSLALIHIRDAQVLYRMGDAVSGLRLKLADPQNAPAVTASLQAAADKDQVWIRDWTFQNRSYFEAVQLEKRMMLIILTLIVAVAVFNLISTLVMTVTEKQADIAILRTLGMSPGGVMRIFMIQGLILGLLGTFIGIVVGVVLSWNVGSIVSFLEQLSGRHFVSSQVYFINYVPSDIEWSDVLTITVISVLLSFLATVYPSRRAAKTSPAEALRYE